MSLKKATLLGSILLSTSMPAQVHNSGKITNVKEKATKEISATINHSKKDILIPELDYTLELHTIIKKMSFTDIFDQYGHNEGLSIIRQGILFELNTIRDSLHLPKIVDKAFNTKYAQYYSEYSNENMDIIDHIDRNGHNIRQRLDLFGGATDDLYAELLTQKTKNIESTLKLLMRKDTSHRTVISSKYYQFVGIGYKNGYITLIFSGQI